MIGTTVADYIFIRACVIFLHGIAPASLLYCFSLLIFPLLLPRFYAIRLPRTIEVWLVAEAMFYIFVFLPHWHHLQRSAVHPEVLSREERAKLFRLCNANVKDPEKYLNRWFLGARPEDIKRENVKEFIRWGFFNTGLAKHAIEDEVEEYVRATERLLGRDILPGKGNARSLRLTLDKVDFLHRSLLWYCCIGVVDTIMYYSMMYNGFRFHRNSLLRFFTLFPFRPLTLLSSHTSPAKYLTYWYRPHTSKTRLPILFVHGIGVGLYPYTNFLRDLSKALEATGDNAGVGIIALEIMPVSSRITHPALDKDVMIEEVRAIVKHHGWSRFVLVSHSYGSIISTFLLKSHLTAHLVGHVVLIDPVSFLLHLPDVAYNFTARQPVHANEHQLWYFGSKDMGVAHALARKFFWSENIIWKEDLGIKSENGDSDRNVTVVLSGKDLIVDTKAVRQYITAEGPPACRGRAISIPNGDLKTMSVVPIAGSQKSCQNVVWSGSGLEVLWFEHLDHAQVFDVEETRRPVIKAIEVYSVKG